MWFDGMEPDRHGKLVEAMYIYGSLVGRGEINRAESKEKTRVDVLLGLIDEYCSGSRKKTFEFWIADVLRERYGIAGDKKE